jgi:hypothetical protein
MPVAANQIIIVTGDITAATFPDRKNYLHMFRADELKTWLRQYDLQILQISASNGISLGWDEKLKDIREDKEKWEAFLKFELEACAKESSHNMGTHIIAVVQLID